VLTRLFRGTRASQLTDQISDLPLGKDVKYNLTMFDVEGHEVLSKTDLAARSASDTVPIKLPEGGNYQMVLFVKQAVTDSPSGPVSDSTRSGRVIGYVVVPEFGMIAAVVMAASMAGIIGFARYRKA
jgi:predicted secreted protein with PEFG-CTERM motif